MQFDFRLGANQSTTLDVSGRFFKYKSGTGLIRVRTTTGGYVDLLPGQGIFDVAFTSLTVSDRTGGANAGVLLAGQYDFRDDRISGSVEVIDGGYARTLAGKAYMGVASISAGVGLVSGAELWNPAGTAKNAVVKRYTIGSAAGGPVFVRLVQSALASVQAPGYSKNPMTANSVIEMRNDKFASGLYDSGNKIDQYAIAVNGSVNTILQEQIIVPPGWGLLFHPFNVNVDITASLEWYEESI